MSDEVWRRLESALRTTTTISFIAVIVGVALVFGAVAGASSVVYPQFATYYWMGASGMIILISGFLVWASQLESGSSLQMER